MNTYSKFKKMIEIRDVLQHNPYGKELTTEMKNQLQFPKLMLTKSSNGMHRVEFGIVESVVFNNHPKDRFIGEINKMVSFHCAVMKRKDGTAFINVGLDVLNQLKLKEGDTIDLTLNPDESVYQFALPEEFEEVIRTDPEAFAVFSKLTPGNQRGILFLVNKLKSTDKRIELSLRIAEKLKAGITKPQLLVKK